jgi:spermidine synthase
MFWYFLFFCVSGLCGILYELIWLRLAMAQFGVTTPMVSIVLSTFMGGLGLGSWIAGRLLRRHDTAIQFPALRLYALAELLIGCSAFIVPFEFGWGHRFLQQMAESSVSSGMYYLVSGIVVAISMLPWCACMGATIPLAMFAICRDQRFETGRSFSYLYISNVAGAVIGTFVPLLFIEQRGFRGTLRVGAALNFSIAVIALANAGFRRGSNFAQPTPQEAPADPTAMKGTLWLLFLTGLTTMAMEMVWIRLYTVYIGPLVYSFALILCSYLFGTFVGSSVYRDASKRKSFVESQAVWVLIPLFGSLPLLLADPRVPLHLIFRVVLGVGPFAAAVGYLTPMLVDRWASGDPDRAGTAYAVNIAGCILGPLLAAFAMLPLLGEHMSMVFLIAPWLVLLAPWQRFETRPKSLTAAYVCVIVVAAILIFARDYEIALTPRQVFRDSTATVTASGTGMKKQLRVNGTGMTSLEPATKMMAHLTLASLEQPPQSVLVICFGMGTTFRSATSWGVSSTAAELVPSVPKLFSFYHADAERIQALPYAHIVIDDGRRYLERTGQTYDAIIIDPPPPVWAAGSSLLYSKEFYILVQKRLKDGGVLQQWLPGAGEVEQASVAKALRESFPYVRVFAASDPLGWHFLASLHPLPVRSDAELVRRMPATAVADMMEWGPGKTPDEQFQLLLSKEMTTAEMIALSPDTPALQDDRPVNEYFLLRSMFPTKKHEVQVKTSSSSAHSGSEHQQ